MLNIGIIGNTEVLEPYVKLIQKNKNSNVIGKASVGTSAQLNGFHFSIPEFNRVELVERADILMIDNSSLLPFDVLCDILRKSKHIFITEYLDLTTEQCTKLLHLAGESGSVIQVCNPNYYHPTLLWLNKNVKTPVYLDITKYVNKDNLRDTLFELILMIDYVDIGHHKKMGTTGFNSIQNEACFYNVRLEFADASVLNLTLGNQVEDSTFKIKGFSKSDSFELNVEANKAVLNNMSVKLPEYLATAEFDEMIDSIQENSGKKGNLEEYLNGIQLVEKVEKKIMQLNS